jgi:predicted nucleic acid-binding protein
MIILDTNVVSDSTKPAPSRAVEDWLDNQRRSDVYLCGPVIMEQAYGAERFFNKTGSRRYLDILDDLINEKFRDQIIEFLDPAPVITGKIRASREKIGRPIAVQDAMIAAICLIHGATLATRNVRDFDGLDLKLVNPFER